MQRRAISSDFSLMCELRSSRPAIISTETLRHLKMSTLKSKYEIYNDINDSPRGYVAWADISFETLTRFLRTGNYPKYLYEWDEGRIRVLLDVFIIRQASDPPTPYLLKALVRDADFVVVVRRGKIKCYASRGGRIRALRLNDIFEASLHGRQRGAA